MNIMRHGLIRISSVFIDSTRLPFMFVKHYTTEEIIENSLKNLFFIRKVPVFFPNRITAPCISKDEENFQRLTLIGKDDTSLSNEVAAYVDDTIFTL
jgi:hypothetical protein